MIDFDVGRAFIPPQEIDPTSTDSGFIFSPVLRAVDAFKSGWITGIVRAKTLSGAPVVDASLRLYLGKPTDPENTWIALQTANTDVDGIFWFTSVTRSGYWAQFAAHTGKTYIVAIDPAPGSGLGRVLLPNLTVNAALETATGITALP